MNNTILTPNNLRIFKAIEETKSMSLAAEKLNLTQSAVSRSIARLEQSLGVALVERKKSPVIFTRAGRFLCAKAGDILAKIDNLESDIEKRKRTLIFDLRIGTSTSVTQNILPYICSEIYNAEKLLSVYNGNTPMICDMLQNGEIDIAIATHSMKNVRGIKAIPVYTEEYMACIPKYYAGSVHDMEDLIRLSRSLPCILINNESYDLVQIDRVMRKWNIRNAITMNGIWATLHLIQQGQGWSLNAPLLYFPHSETFENCAFKSMPLYFGYRTVFVLYKNPLYKSITEFIVSLVHSTVREILVPMCVGTPFEGKIAPIDT